jgi:hypothetical protein
MAISKIGIKFSIDKIPVNKNFDMVINAREEFNYLRYGSNFSGVNAGVSFLSSDPINVRDNLVIDDLTHLVSENSPRKFFEETFFTQFFEVEDAAIDITDIFKETSDGQTVPMYLAHDLSDIGDISSVSVLDGDFNEVSDDLYIFYDESQTLGVIRKTVYTNLRPSYSPETNSYEIFYVRVVRTDGSRDTRVLNPESIYSEVGFQSQSTDRNYRVEQTDDGAEIIIVFNSQAFSPTPASGTQRFSVRSAGSDRIYVLPPIDLPSSSRWYTRINNADFQVIRGGDRLRYHIPEYFAQFFTPVPPYKIASEQRAVTLSPRIIYTQPAPIANLGVDGFYVYIALKDQNNRIVRALTNDPGASVYRTPDGTITEVEYEKDIIESISSSTGFIRLSSSFDESLIPFITYRYIEEFFTYRDVIVNPALNPDILGKKVLFYIVPQRVGQASVGRSVHHLVSDETGNIIESSQDEDFVTFRSEATSGDTTFLQDNTLKDEDVYSGFELQVLTGLNAGRRMQILSYDTINKRLNVDGFTFAIASGDQYRINRRINDYINTDTVSSIAYSYGGWTEKYINAPYWYVSLADLYPVQSASPRSVEIFDIRTRGGGLRVDLVEDALELQNEVQWYWDIGSWDGQAFPGMGALIVEVPRSVLQEVGGPFTRQQVREFVMTHAAEGTYPAIKYYDNATQITHAEAGNSQVRLEWLNSGASSYQVYFGRTPTAMSLFRTYTGAEFEGVIDGLENNATYYFRVNAVVAGVEQLPSRTVIAIPFDPSTVKPGAIYGETIYAEGSYQDA